MKECSFTNIWYPNWWGLSHVDGCQIALCQQSMCDRGYVSLLGWTYRVNYVLYPKSLQYEQVAFKNSLQRNQSLKVTQMIPAQVTQRKRNDWAVTQLLVWALRCIWHKNKANPFRSNKTSVSQTQTCQNHLKWYLLSFTGSSAIIANIPGPWCQ